MPYFYANSSNEVIGPLRIAELRALWENGQITDMTPVIEEGGIDWRTYGDFVLRSAPPPPAQILPVLPAPASRSSEALVQSRKFLRRLPPVVIAVGGVFIAAVLALIVRGQIAQPSRSKHSGPSTSGSMSDRIPETWKLVSFKGKKAEYALLVPNYWHELPQPLDENADRAFTGPLGMIFSIYPFDDTESFDRGLKKSNPTYSNGAYLGGWFIFSAGPVGDMQMINRMYVVDFASHFYAVSLRVPIDAPGAVADTAFKEIGQILNVSKYGASQTRANLRPWFAAQIQPGTSTQPSNQESGDPLTSETHQRSGSILLQAMYLGEQIEHETDGILTEPRSLSKEQWARRAGYYWNWSVGQKLKASASRFREVMGPPSRTQTMNFGGNPSALWYYECRDGTVQLAADARLLVNNGQLQAEVSDY